MAGSSEEAAVYQSRFAAVNAGNFTYAPMEAVPGASQPTPLPIARVPTIVDEALRAAQAYAKSNNSTALLIWRDGSLQAADYFKGTTAQTPLNSKSLAKPLGAIAVGRAIRLGFIRSLDQRVSDYITEWQGSPKAEIRIRHLLDMRSGMLPQKPAPDPNDILNRAYLDPRHDAILINEYPLLHPPGTHFDYANAVADLVAIVIERATHRRYAQFISDAVLRPLGAAGGTIWIDREGGLAHSGCCILLPAETWLRLAILLIDDGRWRHEQLLPRGYVDSMKTPTPQNPYYGLGVYVAGNYTERRGFANVDLFAPEVLHSEPYAAKDLFLFDGNADQVVYIIPSQRLIVLRTGDSPPKSPEWDNTRLPNIVLRGLMKPAPSVGAQPGGH